MARMARPGTRDRGGWVREVRPRLSEDSVLRDAELRWILGGVVTLAVTAFVATFAPKLRHLDLRAAPLEAEELHTPVASFPNG